MMVKYTSIGDRVLERSENTLITRPYQTLKMQCIFARQKIENFLSVWQNLTDKDDDIKIKGSLEESEE